MCRCSSSGSMTTPSRIYQNVSYAELQTFAEHNPNRRHMLEPIEIRTSTQETTLDSIYLPGYSSFNLNPAGILGVLACLDDPSYYLLAPIHARVQQIIERSTALQQQTDHLKNTSIARKRKKMHDLIAASYHGSKMEDKDYIELYHGVSVMCSLQFLLIKEAVQDHLADGIQYASALKGDILFSTPPSTWRKETPTYVVDVRGRWVAIPSELSAAPLSTFLSTWLTSMEQHGWVIQWPVIDATKVKLVEQLSLLPSWKETDKKLSKDTLSARLSRLQTMDTFASWT